VSARPENGRQLDPNDARASIEEFEAGVDRALRDAAGSKGTPRDEPSDRPEDTGGVGK
jgi:hypothetical protein